MRNKKILIFFSGLKIEVWVLMNKYNNLIEVLKKNANGDSGITFINEDYDKFLSYKELYKDIKGILYNLQKAGLNPGDELIIQTEDNESFIKIFWSCLLGGIIPVTLTVGKNPEHKMKVLRIWTKLKKPYIISKEKVYDNLIKIAEENGFEHITLEMRQRALIIENALEIKEEGIEYSSELSQTAFIQFSSGSTGEPKGVILTHENLLTNIYAMITAWKITLEDSMLGWIPLTHDLGLIAFHLTGVLSGINQYIMPTSLFIRNPTIWMKKANQYKVTQLYSPNFGYQYFLLFYKKDMARNWDLSYVRYIINGAEPINTKLCDEFLIHMKKYGMKQNVMVPAYGLAEGTVAVASSPVGENYMHTYIDRRYLAIGQKVKYLLDQKDPGAVSFVDLGHAFNGVSIRICDDENTILKEEHIGNIQIKGKSVTAGYYNDKEATRRVFTEDGWLITGDIGFLRNNRLVVTGRKKDIMFIYGQNYYPHDIERVVEEIEGVEIGKIAVCSVFNSKVNKEEVIVFILYKKNLEDFSQIALNIKKHINEQTGLKVKAVIPVKKFYKTTSGKIQRYKFAEKYTSGEFDAIMY